MPEPNCIHCETTLVPAPPRDKAVVLCQNCRQPTPTGYEDEIRSRREIYEYGGFPLVTAARAIAFSNGIYATARQGLEYVPTGDLRDAESRRRGGDHAPGAVIAQELIKGRSHGGLTDGSVGAAVIAVATGDPAQFISIYVVFRGSVGTYSKAASKFAGDCPNPMGAGRDVTNIRKNVDWRANLDNRLLFTGYAAPSIEIHQGFAQILGSYKHRIYRTLSEFRLRYGVPGSPTIITGHSQGAAHALLFAHWLSYQEPAIHNFVIPFAPPRVGNLEFADDFNRRIRDRSTVLPGDGLQEMSSFLLVQANDKVPKGQKRGGMNLDRKGFFGKNRRKAYADRQLIIAKGLYAMNKEGIASDPTQVYFHPGRLTIAARHGMHKPHKFQASVFKRMVRNDY